MYKHRNKNISASSIYDYEYAFNGFPDDEIRHLYFHVVPPHAKESKTNFYMIQVEHKVTTHTCLCRCTQLTLSKNYRE